MKPLMILTVQNFRIKGADHNFVGEISFATKNIFEKQRGCLLNPV